MTLFCITAAVLLITYKELKNSMGDSDYITIKVPTLKKEKQGICINAGAFYMF